MVQQQSADLDQLFGAYHGAVPAPVPVVPVQRVPERVALVATFGPWADHAARCGCTWCR